MTGTEMDDSFKASDGTFCLISRQREKQSRPSGGLGAALSQYSTGSKDQGMVVGETATNLMKSRPSGGNLLLSAQNRTTSFQSERRRAASPMFNSRAQFQDIQLGSPRLVSSVSYIPHLDPPDLLRSDKPRTPVVHRPQPSRSSDQREAFGSTFSAASSSLYQSNSLMSRRMVSLSQRPKTLKYLRYLLANHLLYI
jgi:hypothetical protein